MVLHSQTNSIAASGRSRLGAISCLSAAVDSVDRPQVNSGIDGIKAHAAVRMHAFPVNGAFWGYTQNTKTPHFQRWKVAPPR